MRFLAAKLSVGVLLFTGLALALPATRDMKDAGRSMKDAGKYTVDAALYTGKATVKIGKDAGLAVAKGASGIARKL
jgi:hypothetical protein